MFALVAVAVLFGKRTDSATVRSRDGADASREEFDRRGDSGVARRHAPGAHALAAVKRAGWDISVGFSSLDIVAHLLWRE